jgi:hypothetical protein
MSEKVVTDLSYSAFKVIRKAFGIAVITTFIGLILPGIVAYTDGVFDSESMARQITPRLPQPLRDSIEKYQTLKAAAERKLYEIKTQFVTGSQLTPEQITSLNSQRLVAERLASAPPPVTFLPFYLSSGMLLWVTALTPLAWLALIFYPGSSPFKFLHPARVIITGIILHVCYQWTVWTRYFVLKSKGRKVIGFANYDVSHGGFWVQELETILFWLLLSMICFQWLEHAQRSTPTGIDCQSMPALADRVSTSFLRWQSTSLLLALGFIPFTAFYWDLVVNAHDMRFLPAAIILHVLWFSAWSVTSIPLFLSVSGWRKFKTHKISEAMDSGGAESIVQSFDAAEPVGDWAKVLSAALTALSFMAPLAKAILSK